MFATVLTTITTIRRPGFGQALRSSKWFLGLFIALNFFISMCALPKLITSDEMKSQTFTSLRIQSGNPSTRNNFQLIYFTISTPRVLYKSIKVLNYPQRQIGSVSINLSRQRAFGTKHVRNTFSSVHRFIRCVSRLVISFMSIYK